MDNSQHSGMQALRKAEEQAGQILALARKARTQRLKEAKSEAEREIAAFRAKEDQRLETLRAERDGSGDMLATLDTDTGAAIEKLRADCATNKDAVVKMLMEVVSRVKTEVPVARKGI